MGKLTHDEFERFATDLAGLVRLDLPLPQGLRNLAESFRSRRLRTVANELAAQLENGMMLSDALAKSPHTFPDEFISLVRCGEISGDPYSLLDFSTDHARRVKRHRAAIVTSIYYPLIVIVTTIAVFLLLSHTVARRADAILEQIGAPIPSITRIVLDGAELLRSTAGTTTCLLAIAVMLVCCFLPRPRDLILNTISSFPGFRRLTELSDCAVVMKFLAVMLPRGVPLPDVLKAAELGVITSRMRRVLESMNDASNRGANVAPFLTGSFPATAAYMFRLSEERGNMAECCANIAHYCEERFDLTSQRTVAILEPLLLLIVGTLVGLVIVSLYLPLFKIPTML